ncbi:pentatricopeptide repeat-containing protein At1g80550, mitochondrial-like [Fagus crenata]
MLCSISSSRRLLSRTRTLLSPSSQSFSPKPISEPHSDHTDFEFDPSTVRETLSSYCNDWKRAFDFFNWVQTQCHFQHNTHTYNRMLDILGKFFEFHLSLDLLQRMKTNPLSRPDHTTFRILFKRYICAHLVTEAIDIFDSLDEFDLKDEMSFSNLIDALCEYKHVVEAYDLCFGKNNKFNVGVKNTKIYNMILRGWFKMGWWGKCREFWEEMDQMGVCKDLHSYSIYMDIMCKSGKPWKAVKLFKEMKKKGIRLDVVAYNTVIRAIGLSEGVDSSVRVFREMRDFGCKPEVATYNTIVKLFCENGRYKEAYDMLDRMHEKGCVPDVITYNCIFRCLEKPREILGLFDRMIESGVRPRMDTYVMLLRKFGRWGFLRPAFIVWKKMEELGCSPDEFAYNALIDALVDKGMIDMARKYDEEMLAKGLSAKPRDELGTKLVGGGSHERDL